MPIEKLSTVMLSQTQKQKKSRRSKSVLKAESVDVLLISRVTKKLTDKFGNSVPGT